MVWISLSALYAKQRNLPRLDVCFPERDGRMGRRAGDAAQTWREESLLQLFPQDDVAQKRAGTKSKRQPCVGPPVHADCQSLRWVHSWHSWLWRALVLEACGLPMSGWLERDGQSASTTVASSLHMDRAVLFMVLRISPALPAAILSRRSWVFHSGISKSRCAKPRLRPSSTLCRFGSRLSCCSLRPCAGSSPGLQTSRRSRYSPNNLSRAIQFP